MSINDNGDVIIKVLSSVLTRLIDVNLKSQHQHFVTKFQSSYAPGISIHAYLERIRKYARCSDACFIVALIYIDRVIEIRNVVLTALNVHRILITSVLVSAKFFDDEFYNNAFYAKLGGVPAWEMNSLEMEFLHLVNFSLFVKEDCFAKYHRELRNFLAVGDIASGVLSPHVPSSTPPQLSSPPRDSLQMKFTSQMIHPKQDGNALPIRPVVLSSHTSNLAANCTSSAVTSTSTNLNNQQQPQRVVHLDDVRQLLNQSHNTLCVGANDSVQTSVHALTSSLMDVRDVTSIGPGQTQNTLHRQQQHQRQHQQQQLQQQASLWSSSIPSSLLTYAPPDSSCTHESMNVGVTGVTRTSHAQAHMTSTRSNGVATATGLPAGGVAVVSPSVDDYLRSISASVAASVFVDVKGYHVAVPNHHNNTHQPHSLAHTHGHNGPNHTLSSSTSAPALMQSSESVSGPQIGSQKGDPYGLGGDGLLGYGYHRGEFKFCPSSSFAQTPVTKNMCNVAGLVANPKQQIQNRDTNQLCHQPQTAAGTAAAVPMATTPCGFHLSLPCYQYNASAGSTSSAMDSPMEVYSLHSPLGCVYDARFDQLACSNPNTAPCGSVAGPSSLPSNCSNSNVNNTHRSVVTSATGRDHQNSLYANFPHCSSYGNGADLSGLLSGGENTTFSPSCSNNNINCNSNSMYTNACSGGLAVEKICAVNVGRVGSPCPISAQLPILNQRAHSIGSCRSFAESSAQSCEGVRNVSLDHNANVSRGHDPRITANGSTGFLNNLHGIPDVASHNLHPHVLLQSGSGAGAAIVQHPAQLHHVPQHLQSHVSQVAVNHLPSVVVPPAPLTSTARFNVSNAASKSLGLGVGAGYYCSTGAAAGAGGVGVVSGVVGYYEQWGEADYAMPVRVGNT